MELHISSDSSYNDESGAHSKEVSTPHEILDASIRDVSACLSDNQKADLLLYAIRSLHVEGRYKTVIDNAIQSCLQISTLSPENTAKARILRARVKLACGSQFSAQEDLQAALAAEPDNPEAKALLHHRSVAVEKLLSPMPHNNKERFSNELWREIALLLPRGDLKTILFVPHALSRIASQLLFRKIDLHFRGWDESDEDGIQSWPQGSSSTTAKDQHMRHARRTADILTRIIVDKSFASGVRTLNIYAPMHDKDGSMAFETGVLINALPKLTNLRNVHISACSDEIVTILRIVQSTIPRLQGLSLFSAEGACELGFLEFTHLTHFAYTADREAPGQTHNFILQNRDSLRTISIDNRLWTFPTDSLAIRNLTRITFAGHFPANSQAFADILSNGRQLESLSLRCSLDCLPSSQFRALQSSLPFLRHFAFSISAVNRRATDSDLFPAISDFLRNRKQMKTVQLTADDEAVQRAVGYDASIWGVLPSLVNLRGLTMSYPRDLSPGLASWLIPRGVLALTLNVGPWSIRDAAAFLNHLRPGIPPTLRYIGFSKSSVPMFTVPSGVVEEGFPMVRVVRIGKKYWTVNNHDGNVGMELWPRRRVVYHRTEWLEWLGCSDAIICPSSFSP